MTHRYTLENVVRRYREARTGRSVEALRVRRLDVAAGEILAVVGPNGSGKSSLLETMAFLQRPDGGRILLDGRDVWAERKSLAARRRCPILLQKTVLFKTTVLRNVMYGLRMRGLGRAEARRRAEAVLRLVRLDRLAQRGNRELSGGERQRVALARLLVLGPEILLLDEPTANVDRANEQLIEQLIRQLHQRNGMTVILASHSFRQATTLADRIVTLVDGQLMPGTMDNLFTGTLCREAGVFAFRDESGLVLRFRPEAMAREDRNACPAPDTPVRIAVDTKHLLVVSDGNERMGVFSGRIESVRRHRDRCRLRVRLVEGHVLRVEMTLADYKQLGLNLGTTVRLRLADGAIHLVRTLNPDYSH